MTTEPYVGPRPFAFADRERFFGRKDETDEAVSLVMAYPVVLIYALSGVGKTSLVNAGLVPLLREEGYTVLPPARVQGVLPAGIERSEIPNEYVFHALSCWLNEQSVPFNAAAEITGLRLVDFLGKWLAAWPATLAESSPVLVFDQFEAIFVGHKSLWQERDDFFAQMAEALAKYPGLKAVFVLPEEFIARLEPFAGKFPRGLRARKRLERLREAAALEAITKPVESFGVHYEEGVAEKLVHDLRGVETVEGTAEVLGEFVEPVQLQVVCRNLWDKLPADFKKAATSGADEKPAERLTITQAHVDAAGEVTAALSNYYNEAIEIALRTSEIVRVRAGPFALQTSELPEGQLRRWFAETLIVGDGLGMGVKGQGATAAVPEAAIRALEDRYLVRREKRGETEWFELSHARFIKPILKSNAAWLEARSGPDATRRKLLRRARELNQSGGSLEEWELGEAENFLNSPQARELGNRGAIEALVQRSRDYLREKKETRERELKQRAVADLQARQLEHNRKAIHLRNILLTVLAGMIVVAVIGWFFAMTKTKEAEKQTQVAHDQTQVAKEQTRLATEQQQIAKARELAFRAVDAIRDDPERAVLLAMHSYSTVATSEGASAWHQALVASPIRLRLAGENGHLDPKTREPCSVLTCAYSRDGRQILTGGLDNTVRIWNAENGCFEGKLGEDGQWHTDQVWSVAFSPDGSKVASASKDGTVRLWPYPKPVSGPWPTPEVFMHVGIRDGKPPTIRSVAFDKTGTRILTCCDDGTARVWNVSPKKEVVRLTGHQRPEPTVVRAGSFCPTAPNFVVTAAQDNTAKLWSLDDVPASPEGIDVPELKEPVRTFKARGEEDRGMWDAEFSPDGKLLITAGGDHMLTLWDVDTGLLLAETKDHTAPVVAAKFIDDQSAVSVSIDKTVRLWNIERIAERLHPDGLVALTTESDANAWRRTFTPKGILRGHTDYLRNVDIAPNRRRLVTSSRDGTARVWRLPPNFEVATIRAGDIVWDVAFSPDGTRAVTAAGDTPMVWEIQNFTTEDPQPRKLPKHEADVKCVGWSPDGTLIATADRSGFVRICNAADHTEWRSFHPAPEVPISALAFSPTSQHLAIAAGTKVFVWHRNNSPLTSLPDSNTAIPTVSFSPDGRKLLIGETDGDVSIWNWESGSTSAAYHPDLDIILDAGFSPDGRLIVLAGANGTIAVLDSALDLNEPNKLKIPPEILKGHEGQVRKARFFTFKSAGAERLAILSAGFDSTVRIWQVNEVTKHWTQMSQLPGASGPIYAIACSGDGVHIVTGGADKFGRVYYRDPEWLFELANSRVTRVLTDDERAQYDLPLKKR